MALARSEAAAPVDRARLAERLGRYRWEAGDLHAAVDATEEAAALLPVGPPSALRARVLAALADPPDAAGRVQRGAADRRAGGRRGAAGRRGRRACPWPGHARHHQGTAGGPGGGDRGAADVVRPRAPSPAASMVSCGPRPTMHTCCCWPGDSPKCSRWPRPGARWRSPWPPLLVCCRHLDNNAAAALYAVGRWEDADRLLAELTDETSGSGARYLELMQLELAVARGDTERAARVADALKKTPPDPGLTAPLHACLAEQALYAADPGTAAAEVLDGFAVLAGTGWSDEEIRLLAIGARVAAEIAALPLVSRPVGLPELWEQTAATFADRARAITDRDGEGRQAIAAFGALAAAEHARKEGTDDRATWRAVAGAWQAAGQPYREAYARLREAAAAAGVGRRDQAARALAASQALARGLPSPPLLSLVAEFARRARLAPPPAQPRPAVAHARFDITRREADVLALLAEGASNRQIARALFISERTVAVHVSRIFDKLGVRNRTEAATVGARLALATPATGRSQSEEARSGDHPDDRD